MPVNVRAEKLVKKYGWVTALEEVSLEIEPGQIVAVLEPNGAGKTTLLNALAGVIQLDSGRMLMDGQPYTPGSDELRRRFAFLPDISLQGLEDRGGNCRKRLDPG